MAISTHPVVQRLTSNIHRADHVLCQWVCSDDIDQLVALAHPGVISVESEPDRSVNTQPNRVGRSYEVVEVGPIIIAGPVHPHVARVELTLHSSEI